MRMPGESSFVLFWRWRIDAPTIISPARISQLYLLPYAPGKWLLSMMSTTG